ncbi:septation protein A [Methylobacterium aerolatum]|uniref:Inner membrane-spanning protein YciB n=1 Tax=Methylobacterium aerolatum TaxID=418708 RepID=A0ABU0HUR0_9HYPH|nr:septation protein A [Methylobacterium aerolatum]MDQ0445558.1 intracellular septation protein [Methylobacterium aerolatum]GJD36331.1 Intracellular septation protein [Methylobacterium aerolatum]
MQIESVPPRRHLPPLAKLALEMGPLVLFFLTNAFGERFGLIDDQATYAAIGLFVGATIVSLAIHFALLRRIPIMPLVSGVVVLVFGGLALALRDKTFFVIKPTIVNGLFGVILLGGLLFRKALLSVVLDSVFALTEEGWRQLTLRWGLFFLFLAGLNEVIWRTQDYEFWVKFKVFGIMPITVLFALAQTPLLMKYEKKQPDA